MRLLLVLLAALLAAIYGLRHLERTRPQDLPWTPLDLRAPIGLATHAKLALLARDPPLCQRVLRDAGIAFTPVPNRRDGPNCGYRDVVFLRRSTVAYAPQPLRLTCPMVAALAVWERQVVRPAARRLLAGDVARIDHYGGYACRRLYGRDSGAWSEHATANALDVAGFRLTDGRAVSVAGDWKDAGARGAFLRTARDGACRLFGTTLSPDYNAAHASHFHLDMKAWTACR